MGDYDWTRLMAKLREIESNTSWMQWLIGAVILYVILLTFIVWTGFSEVVDELHEIAELLGHEHG